MTKVRMISALVGPHINHQPGDIVETDEAARWIEFGIAEAVSVARVATPIETAELPLFKETAKRLRAKAPAKSPK
ncbi:hypothetical protein HNO88_002790 [Novosphingobium chloroacetimidivorans]|uniref:Uncharacterized protein n=1 Tax=Novosphingobium chloroacetimidivorans TaxID=1428314 RepID=A0A7W7NWL6_9SPHN|nr:hypothetical protein [Novosphingobium chloroacetimidivorans]MBB4859461.1 hypothetical protein [Novosphingobium chloroacetimidivorans]